MREIHQFFLCLCALGLWWWGVREPPPSVPWRGTVVGHEVFDDGRSGARVAWIGPDGVPTLSLLASYGLRHEPGEVIRVYPVPGDSGWVREWTGFEWPWLAWLLGLTLAHGLALFALRGAPKPYLQAWSVTAAGLCWLALLWVVVSQAGQSRWELLRRGVPAEAVVVESENTSSGSGRSARVESIVHYAALAAQPPRDVQINTRSPWLPEGTRIPLLYLPEAPTQVLLLPTGSTLGAWLQLGFLLLLACGPTWLWGKWLRRYWRVMSTEFGRVR